ncbi:MAG: CBS domain-containing protein [Vampirovibrio sp.]|nr:CBS domain-containing protein [Vampirovibrio sp.]
MEKNEALLSYNPPVSEVMSRNVIFVQETDAIPSTIQMFESKRISAAPVKNAEGKCVGIVTKSDLSKLDVMIQLIQLEARQMEASLFVKNVMNPTELRTLSVNASLKEASQMMVAHRIHHVFISDDAGNVVGVTSTFDIAKAYANLPACQPTQ